MLINLVKTVNHWVKSSYTRDWFSPLVSLNGTHKFVHSNSLEVKTDPSFVTTFNSVVHSFHAILSTPVRKRNNLLYPLESRIRTKLPKMMVNYFWNIYLFFSSVTLICLPLTCQFLRLWLLMSCWMRCLGFFLLMLIRVNVAINLIILTTFQECGIWRLKALGNQLLYIVQNTVLVIFGLWTHGEELFLL